MSLLLRRSYAQRQLTHLARWFSGQRPATRPRLCLILEQFENRLTPATAVLSSGVLTIDFTATGAGGESVTVAASPASSITVSGVVGGNKVFAAASVTAIVVMDSGGSNNQALTFAAGSAAMTLSGGMSVAGVETVDVKAIINATSTGAISITAPKTIRLGGEGVSDMGKLTTVSGNITLNANQQATPMTGSFFGIKCDHATISTTSGSIAINGRSGNGPSMVGVAIKNSSTLSCGASGGLSINAVSASVGPFAWGLETNDCSITSGGANISIFGAVGSTGTAIASVGVAFTGGTKITAAGWGSVTVEGIAGPGSGGGGCYGVAAGSGSSITTAGGSVTVKGRTENLPSEAVNLSGYTITTLGKTGAINLIADSLYIDTGTKIQAGSSSDSTVTIAPYTAATKVSIGGADVIAAPQILGLTNGELSRVFAGTIIIGSDGSGSYPGVSTGSMTLSADVIRTSKTAISLATTGSILLTAKLDAAGGNITANAGGSILQTTGTILAGTLTLNAPNQTATFNSTGNKAGQLVIPATVTAFVNGSFDSAGFVQVDGTLGGTGSVGVTTVSSTGRIKPGSAAPGKLTTGSVAFNAGSVFDVQLNGASYSQLAASGTVNLGGATLQVGASGPNLGQPYRIIDNLSAGDVTGTFAGYAEGAPIVVGTNQFIVSYKGGTGNDVTLSPPSVVSSIVFGDGTIQRSTVRQMVVNFSQPVNFAADAFTLTRSGTGGPVGPVNLALNPLSGPASSVTITFSGSLTEYDSLVNGFYDFAINAAKIISASGNLDGDANGTGGDNYNVIGTTANKFFRLFGDADGDATVGMSDFNAIRPAFNQPNGIFDLDGDGLVGLADFARFRTGYGTSP